MVLCSLICSNSKNDECDGFAYHEANVLNCELGIVNAVDEMMDGQESNMKIFIPSMYTF